MSPCPPPDVLGRFGSGSFGASTDLSLDAHINGCPDCQRALDRLAARISSGDGGAAIDPEKLPRIPGFAIGPELGRGGMGVVFHARELHPDREVAVKFLSSGPFATHRERERWLKEARAAARVRHPHIVQLFQVAEVDGWPYLVLEYLPGGSLRDRLTGPLAPRNAARLLLPLARALEQLHQAGVWHLDLKPGNILIDAPSGTPLDRAVLKLADFGIARSRDDAATTAGVGSAQGTLLYMAPEQLGGPRSALGPATDVHAMGVILYELLTGRPPFLADSGAETIRRIQMDDPVSPRRLSHSVPRDLEVICRTCLEKDPRRRYPSAGALADDLGRWLDGRPIAARPAGPLARAWKSCRRRPLVAALLAALAITLASGFVAVVRLWRLAETARLRAEADYELGRAALTEILHFGQSSLEPDATIPRDRFVLSLNSTRSQILELARRRPDDPDIWYLIALVDLYLGRNLEYQRRLAEGEAIYVESLGYWDRSIRDAPGEFQRKYRRWQTLESLGRIVFDQGRPAESVGYLERAIAEGESVLPLMSSPDLNTMAACRSALARSLLRLGDRRRARALHEANIAMIRRVPPADRSPHLSILLDEALAETLFPGHDAEADLAGFRAALVADPARPGSPDAAEDSELAYGLARRFSAIAKRHRDAGDIDACRRTVEQLLEFGRLIVARHPDRAASHLALAEGHAQSAKLGWVLHDRAAIEDGLRRALHEARRARSLDPDHRLARAHETAFERRLLDLLAPEPESDLPTDHSDRPHPPHS